MNLLLVGYGRMGRLVERVALEDGDTVVGRVDIDGQGWGRADVAIDFSTADALVSNFDRYVELKMPVVIGTTGWGKHEAVLRAEADRARLGVVASANFSIGVNIFQLLVSEAARLTAPHPQYGAWIHEQHHVAKIDAPSGTALLLKESIARSGFERPIDIASTRAGMIPGTHTVGFDGPSDTIELTHRARDRRGFATGALLAARWIQGRDGWYSMADVLKP
jgi:4-hydroxy-tetrahydrodipicolinate reductase